MLKTPAILLTLLLSLTSCSSSPMCPKRVENTATTYGQHLEYLGDLERQYDACTTPVKRTFYGW